jgi:hypothetical protein
MGAQSPPAAPPGRRRRFLPAQTAIGHETAGADRGSNATSAHLPQRPSSHLWRPACLDGASHDSGSRGLSPGAQAVGSPKRRAIRRPRSTVRRRQNVGRDWRVRTTRCRAAPQRNDGRTGDKSTLSPADAWPRCTDELQGRRPNSARHNQRAALPDTPAGRRRSKRIWGAVECKCSSALPTSVQARVSAASCISGGSIVHAARGEAAQGPGAA